MTETIHGVSAEELEETFKLDVDEAIKVTSRYKMIEGALVRCIDMRSLRTYLRGRRIGPGCYQPFAASGYCWRGLGYFGLVELATMAGYGIFFSSNDYARSFIYHKPLYAIDAE